jgi:hypothetical protein
MCNVSRFLHWPFPELDLRPLGRSLFTSPDLSSPPLGRRLLHLRGARLVLVSSLVFKEWNIPNPSLLLTARLLVPPSQ